MSRAGAEARARARHLWLGFETIHAVTYFHPTCLDAITAAGAKGFWMGYFAARMAPMGAIGPETATAVCFGFAPSRPARALPDAWAYVEPATAIEVRATSAAAALRLAVPDVDERAAAVVATAEHLVEGLVPAGRPLGAGNLGVDLGAAGDDPVARLWQACTALREHRGDGHVAAWVAAGCTGLEANVLSCAAADRDPEDLLASRGWSPVEWLLATTALHARGLLATPASSGGGALAARATDAGRAVHDHVEETTDALAAATYTAVGTRALEDLATALVSMGADVTASGALRYPNPIGLPPA